MTAIASRYDEMFIADLDFAPGTVVTVRNPGTLVAADLWTDETATAAAANPVTVDADGNLRFWVKPGNYDLFANGATVADVVVGVHPDNVVRTTETQTVTGVKTYSVAGPGSSGTIALKFTTEQAANSGTRGLKLNRPALGVPASNIPLGLTLQTAAVDQWDVVTLDYETNDLVVVGDHWSNGEESTRLFADQLRFAHGGFGEFGHTVGLQSRLRRFCFSTDADDDVLMTNLVLLQVKADSPVLYPLRVITGELGSSVDQFFVQTTGAVWAKSEVTAGGFVARGTTVGLTTSIELDNDAVGGRTYRVTSGIEAISQTGFSIRDLTAGAPRVAITGPGTILLAKAAEGVDLATNATDGFLVIPQMNGVPTGVPTAYGGNSGGAICFDKSNGRLYVYVHGVGWWKTQLSA